MSKPMSLKDRVRQRAESHRTGGGGTTIKLPDGVDWFSPRKGVVRLDILPYTVTAENHPEAKAGDIYFERTFHVHRDIGPNAQQIVCPSTVGKPCPVCEEWRSLRKQEGIDEKTVDALRPKERQLFIVIDLDKDPDKILLWDASYHLFGKLLEQEIREGDESNAGFCELTGGKTLKVRFEEQKQGKFTFFEATRIDFEDRDDYDDAVLETVPDLDACLIISTYEELNALFTGDAGDDDDKKDDEEKPPLKKPSLRKPGGKAPPPEKEEEDDDDKKDEPADENEGGRKIQWEYKGAAHTGVIVEELEDGAIRVKDDDDGKIKFLNEGDYEDFAEEEVPPPKKSGLRKPGGKPAEKEEAPPAKPGLRRRRVENND